MTVGPLVQRKQGKSPSRPWLLLSMAWLWAVVSPVNADPVQLPAVELKIPPVYQAAQAGRQSYLYKEVRRFQAGGESIGELQDGWFCSHKGNVQWNEKSAPLLLPHNLMVARYYKMLKAAKFPIREQTDSLFDEPSKKSNTPKFDLQVGSLIKSVAANLCNKNTEGWTGEAYVKIFWQVNAPDQNKVIFETTTEGLFSSKNKPIQGPVSNIMLEAFGAAVNNLLAEPGFLAAINTPVDTTQLNATLADPTTADGKSALLAIDGVGATHDGSVSKNITQLRSAVATVFGDKGSGSGFFIGRSGWMLTNQHVVGTAKFVKVRLTTGRELVGEVQRSDAVRDVALVKTEVPGVAPIPIRQGEPGIGENVYALGSPLGDAFNTTLTRGILSGVREIDDKEYLQSDVAILPGSSGGPLLDESGQVVGLTVMGLGARGVAGLNFFHSGERRHSPSESRAEDFVAMKSNCSISIPSNRPDELLRLNFRK